MPWSFRTGLWEEVSEVRLGPLGPARSLSRAPGTMFIRNTRDPWLFIHEFSEMATLQ